MEVQSSSSPTSSRETGPVVKRLTASGLDSKDSDSATWAGQAFTNGTASGTEVLETLSEGNKVVVRGSEAVLVIF